MGRTVLAWKNIPPRWPIPTLWLSLLTLDIYDAPGWLWGVVITLLVLLFAGNLYDKMNLTVVELKDAEILAPEVPEDVDVSKNGKSLYRQ